MDEDMGGSLIFDFTSPETSGGWRIVNDTVMGGISNSELAISTQNTVIFRGTLSLENNGGFASVHTVPKDYQLRDYAGIRMLVRGDGRHYKLRVRTANAFDGPAYEAEFETVRGKWLTVTIPFQSMVATLRGRALPNIPKLEGGQIQQLGLMIADKNEGAFEVEIDWIKAYRTTT